MNLRDNLCEMNGQVGFAERKRKSQQNLNEYRFEMYGLKNWLKALGVGSV